MQLARADVGGTQALLESAYLDDVVTDALAPWRGEAARRGIAIELDDLDEAPAQLDPRLVTRMLNIFVHNALQYTPGGGHIGVSVSRRDGRAELQVDDSGIGIAPDERERIFERFFRGTRARQRAPEGSGLGLAIAAWIAEQHGAVISVGEGRRGGAQFRVTFPSWPASA